MVPSFWYFICFHFLRGRLRSVKTFFKCNQSAICTYYWSDWYTIVFPCYWFDLSFVLAEVRRISQEARDMSVTFYLLFCRLFFSLLFSLSSHPLLNILHIFLIPSHTVYHYSQIEEPWQSKASSWFPLLLTFIRLWHLPRKDVKHQKFPASFFFLRSIFGCLRSRGCRPTSCY